MLSDTSALMHISAAGMRAQGIRMRIISENLANSESVSGEPGGDPYRRKTVSFRNMLAQEMGVSLVSVRRTGVDPSPFVLKYEPDHVAADAGGYVRYPNVNPLIELADMREAQRSYEANLGVLEVSKGMAMKAIELLR